MLDNLFSQIGVIVGGVVLALILLAIVTIKNLIVLVPPNMAAVITGRKRVADEGTVVGYRTVMGGRSLRVPLIEQVNWLSLSTVPLELSVEDAFSKGNIPLTVKAVANVKIASTPEIVFNNAVERLLGKNISQIEALARETLTGNLRGVLAKLTPEEVNEDRLGFAKHLSEEADHDLKKLGLQLDVLKIQHVADRVGYLTSIGEKRTAEALRDAEIAKATAIAETRLKQAEARKVSEVAQAENEAEIKQRQAAARQLAQIAEAEAEAAIKQQQANAHKLAEVAQAQAEAEIKQQQATARRLADVAAAQADVTIAEARNELRVRQAELGREAETTERVAKVTALKAETEARTEMEARRVEMEKTRLQADVVQPAEARRLAAESEALALAAPILQQGKAQAEVLRMLYAEIQKAGDTGLQVFLAEKLPAMLGVTAEAMKDVKIERLTVVDSGGGQGVANAATQKVSASIAALEQIAGALGLDLDRLVKRIGGNHNDGVTVVPRKIE
ncbi:MAG TPA: SPFH domain-containing protein [Gemmatimonadaceae bacterium]|nr:SPFH domain-containing protein [Gemmatimonadaceae bacterium]